MTVFMRRRVLASSALALALALVATPARAMRGASDALVAPGEAALRIAPSVAYRAPSPAKQMAWSRLITTTGDVRWRALWDEDTGAPLRVFGGFDRAPGSVASSAVAEAHARAFLAAHLDLIAAGSSIDDFALVADDLTSAMRTVAFEQRVEVAGVGAVRVPGAIVSFRYKNDRMFVFASEATHASALDAPKIKANAAAIAARAWVAKDHRFATTRGGPELVAHRMIHRGREEIRLAYRVEVVTKSPRGAFEVFVDARTGKPISRASLLRFASEAVAIDAPVRGPDGARMNYPAVLETVDIGATAAATDASGEVSWTDPSATTLTTIAAGQFAEVDNQDGPAASSSFPLADGGQALWSLAADEFGDAQLSAYVHVNRVREHALTIAPDMAFLTSVIVAKPNEDDPQGCNAFWDGSDLNFYRQNSMCNNTARIADVVYHEFGHGFHQHAAIPGVVAMIDPALGEGTADYMAVSLTGDPNVAPGFYLGQPNVPLRSVDTGRRWPDDISSDPHETGLIWVGSLWDLRTYLQEDLDADTGAAIANQLYFGAIQRASDIPSTYVEVLAADDDDGDLGNGTPHFCEIERAFSAHGLADGLDATGLTIAHRPLDIVVAEASSPITVTVERPHPECKHEVAIDNIVATVTRGEEQPIDIDLRPDGKRFLGELPPATSGSVFGYHLTAKAGTTSIARPDNRADPDYYVFAGETEKLFCTGFENGADGFTFDDGGFGTGTFAIGAPGGKGGDPDQAYDGKNVLGTTLGGSGLYLADRKAFAHGPVVDLKGARQVHLQMRRWLTVEDGFYDHATISVNGTMLWQNLGTNESDGTLDLLDKEWRFFDLDISSVVGESAQVTLGLDADPVQNFGGWNVDELCIVAVKDAPPEATGASTGAGGGCGCETSGKKESSGGALIALAMLALARRRK
jgi:MYXO-CTERM domain-containing protein